MEHTQSAGTGNGIQGSRDDLIWRPNIFEVPIAVKSFSSEEEDLAHEKACHTCGTFLRRNRKRSRHQQRKSRKGQSRPRQILESKVYGEVDMLTTYNDISFWTGSGDGTTTFKIKGARAKTEEEAAKTE